MSKRMLHCFPVAIAITTALALSGCGGGSNTRTDTGTGMTEDTDTGMTEDTDTGMTEDTDTGMTEDTDTGMTGGTDTGMTGGGQTLTPEGLVRSTATPVYATNADSYESAGLETQYPALSANMVRDWSESTVTLGSDGDLHIKSIAGDYEAVSGNVEIMVTYEYQGELITVSFTDNDFLVADGYWTTVDDDGVEVSFWLGTQEFTQFNTVGAETCDEGVCIWSYGTIGARTEAASMPSGIATYWGTARADSFLENEPSSNPNHQRIWGVLRLTADFAGSSLDGRITNIQVRRGSESNRTDWPETTYLAIDEGKIVNGQFTAKLTGMDSNANAPMNESLSGYEGDVLGEFYGPAAEEVGGVFNASRDDRVMIGWLGGARLDPDRLPGSSRTAVSVGVDQDFSASTSQLTDAAASRQSRAMVRTDSM